MWLKRKNARNDSWRNFKKDSNFRRQSSKYNNEEEQISDKSPMLCYKCKRPGHIKSDCPRLTQRYAKKESSRKKKALLGSWHDLEESLDEVKWINDNGLFSLMASINDTDDKYHEVQYKFFQDDYDEMLTHSLALSTKYKLLKKKFLKLEKDFSFCKTENP